MGTWENGPSPPTGPVVHLAGLKCALLPLRRGARVRLRLMGNYVQSA